MFDKEVWKAMKNIYVSRAISKLEKKSSEFKELLEIFSYKYGEESVKAALRELYSINKEVKDIKGLTISLIVKYDRRGIY